MAEAGWARAGWARGYATGWRSSLVQSPVECRDRGPTSLAELSGLRDS